MAFRYSGDRRGIDVASGVTTPARTWLDIARNGSLADALSVGDAALRRGVMSREEARLLVDGLPAGRGSRRAPRALQEINPARETPLESASWAYFLDWGVPLPAPQVEYRDDVGCFVGRVDFAWDSHRVIGECDGRIKYANRDALYKEKRREDALRAMGLTVVRWGAVDLRYGALAARLRGLLG